MPGFGPFTLPAHPETRTDGPRWAVGGGRNLQEQRLRKPQGLAFRRFGDGIVNEIILTIFINTILIDFTKILVYSFHTLTLGNRELDV